MIQPGQQMALTNLRIYIMMRKNDKKYNKQQVSSLDLLKNIIVGDVQGQELKGAILCFNAQLDRMQNINELCNFFNTGSQSFAIGKTLLGTINTYFNLYFESLDKEVICLLIKIVKFVLKNKDKYKNEKWSKKNTKILYANLIVRRDIKFTFNEKKVLSDFPTRFIDVLKIFLKNCNEKTIEIFANKTGLKFLQKLDLYINHTNKNVRDTLFKEAPQNNFQVKYLELINFILKKTWKNFPLKSMLKKKSFSDAKEIFTKWLVFTEWIEIHSKKLTSSDEEKRQQQFYQKVDNKFNLLDITKMLNSFKNSQQNLPGIIKHIIKNEGKINLEIKMENSDKCIVINTGLSNEDINKNNLKLHQNFLVKCAQYQGLTIKFFQNILKLYGMKKINAEKKVAVENLKKLFEGMCNIFTIKYLNLLMADPEKHSILCKLMKEKGAIIQTKCINDNDVIYIMPINEVLEQIYYIIKDIYSTFPNKITSKFNLDIANQALNTWCKKKYKLGFSLDCLLDKLSKIDVTNRNIGTDKIIKKRKAFVDYINEGSQVYVDNIYKHILLIDKMVSPLGKFCNRVCQKTRVRLQKLGEITTKINVISFEEKCKILRKIFANQGAILEHNNKPIYISHFKSKIINRKNHEHYYKLLELFLRFDKWELQDYKNVAKFFSNCKLIYSKGIKNQSLFQGQKFYANQLYKKLQEFIQRFNKKFSKKAKQSNIFVLELNKNQKPNEYLITFEKKKVKNQVKKIKGKINSQTQS